jgi:excisionase family DNA binding protein
VTAPDRTRPKTPELGDLPPVLKVAEVSAYLRCDTGTVYAAIREGRLPVIRLGRAFRVSRAALANWVGEDDAHGAQPRFPDLDA